MHIIHYFLLLPVVTVLLLLVFQTASQVKTITLAGALMQLGLLGFITNAFMQGDQTLNLVSTTWYDSLGINLKFGVDGMALCMLWLTALVVLAGILVSWNISHRVRDYFILLLLLSAGAYGFFLSLDLFCMFFFLELAVIPKYLLIAIWGSGNKVYSANKLVLMLMGASALVLVGIMGLYFYAGVEQFSVAAAAGRALPLDVQLFIFPFLFIGFGVFTALFPFHTWVPDGHSSAPTAASMFLAGISMKLGGFGILRTATLLLPAAAQYYSPYIIALAAVAILYGSFATMMQTDLKYINAYSSVSHTGFVLLGIGFLTQAGITGAIIQMVSHGLMTALFFAVIGMIYERTHTRNVAQMQGLLKMIPFISVVFVLAGLTSLGLPGLSGFVAEMMVFVGGWQGDGWLRKVATLMAAASIVITAVYILRATGKVIMGEAHQTDLHFADARWYEKSAAVLLIAGILFIGLMPHIITSLAAPAAEEILNASLTLNNINSK